MNCKVCLSVIVEPQANLEWLIDRISDKKPDIVEFRLDKLENAKEIEMIAQKKKFPSIATDKSSCYAHQLEKLSLAAAAGFEFIDIDIENPQAMAMVQEVKSHQASVIASFHDRKATPSHNKLSRVLELEKQAGGDVCKIVTTATHPRDNLTILEFLSKKPPESRVVSFAMGSHGVPSRILSPLFGSEFSYAAIDQHSLTAPGQLTIDNLRIVWQLLEIQ